MLATRAGARNELWFRRAACAIFVAGSLYWLWQSSSPWDRPVWPILGIVAAWLVVLVGLDEDALSRTARALSVGVLSLVTLGFLFLVVYLPLGISRYRNLGPLERTATSLLDGSAVPSNACGPGTAGVGYGELGVPDEVCVRAYDNSMGAVRHVEFRWDNRWLVYEGGDMRETLNNRCFSHLQGPWWALTVIGDDMNCPTGFAFSGSG